MSSKNKNERLVNILCYLLVGIIWYFADKEVQTKSTKFHVKQAVNLFIIDIVGTAILSIIPIIGWLILPLFQLAMLVLWIVGLVNSINGKSSEIPFIGKFAEKYLTF